MDSENLIAWKDDVDDHDYDAAFNYLSLGWGAAMAEKAVEALRSAELCTRRANDIIRSCQQDALPITDPGVHKDLVKLLSGRKFSPVLVVNFEGSGIAVTADGWHRVCLAYDLDPYGDIPLKMASV